MISETMLKKKIRFWDLQRNLKKSDMEYALRIYYQRESQGKKTAFLVRNRLVTFDDIRNYIRRKGVDDLESLGKAAPTRALTANIACYRILSINPVLLGGRARSRATQSHRFSLWILSKRPL